MTPTARLNVFQKTQRLWDTLHPYNAAQAMELVGDFPAERVDAAFVAAVDDLGLGDFACDGREYRIERTTPAPAAARPAEGFEAWLTAEMNRPFDAARAFPFRPFDLTDNGRRFVGLTYQHWVADSVSVRMLVRQWLTRLVGDARRRPVRLPTGGLLRAFGPATADWSPVAQAASLFTLTSRMRRMRRCEPVEGTQVSVILRDGPDGLIGALRRRVRSHGATVGDAFIAAAAAAIDSHGPGVVTRRRPGLCLGTIVDLRARGNMRRAADLFGLFLGFTMTDFSPADLAEGDAMLRRATAARRSGAARRSAEASQLNLAVSYEIVRRLSPRSMCNFYRKRFPLVGGLSSVNMTPGWAGDAHPSPLAAYHRVSPTGPMLPLVLTPTTLGDRLCVCCTFRPAVVDPHQANAIVDTFFARVCRIAD